MASNGNKGFVATLISTQANSPKITIPRTRGTMVSGVAQPTIGAWFQAKLNKTNDMTPMTAPGKSNSSVNFRTL
ncbi:hypothetical protein RRF57_009273 [Xylaria bambusicola]|uniref:Uncharacterized protein n=1 Tax=Xylaria bambusicola TaxID=326684 RepID=A0AAN7V2G4_9PEZI